MFCNALFTDMLYQLFTTEVQACQVQIIFPFEIVVDKSLIDAGFTDIVYGSAGVSIFTEFV